MCHECDELQRKIQRFRRFMEQPFDPLTIERLASAVGEMEAKKAALHPDQK